VVFGDKRKSLVALLALDEAAAMEYAHEQNWSHQSFEELSKSSELRKYLKKEIQLRSDHFADYEQVRNFFVLPTELSVDEGELTATMKIKRNVIAKKYKTTI